MEISTFRFTRENSVVAAVPILIFAISPMVSFSCSVNGSEASSLPADIIGLFSKAFISS